jgi:hypothetical protein
MPQQLDYPAVSGKRWEWHLVLFKEWLRTVEGGITERKYTKWLRIRKVFDRGFIAFAENLLGVEHPARKPPRIGEVGEELLEELANSEERARDAQEKLASRGPGRDMPRSRSALPPAPGQRRRRGAPEPEPEPEPEDTYKPPSADSDPFLRALLERFTELNPYLSMFVYKEILEDFLSPAELFRRIGTNDFLGARPTMPQFNAWLQWFEWLGGIKKVGFRHKFTQAGTDVGKFLMEMPLEELLHVEEEPEPEPEPEPTTTKAAAPPPAAEDDEDADEDAGEGEDEDGEDGGLSAPGFEPPADEEFDDEELEEEGLDLPPSVEMPEAGPAYWKVEESPAAEAAPQGDAVAVAEPPQPEPAPTPRAESAPRAEPAPRAKPEPQPAVASAPSTGSALESPSPAATPAPARPAPSVPPPALAAPPVPLASSSASIEREALQLAARWWLERPVPEKPLSESGVNMRPHPSGQQVGLFKLLALATLLEAGGPPAEARELFAALEEGKVLVALLVDEAPLERALEVAWARGAPARLEERLVHLLRYRRGLAGLDPELLWGDARSAARALREHVTGDTLGPGLIFVLRELAAGGVGPKQGLEGLAWLPSLLEP